MDQKFRSSFIPKKTVVSKTPGRSGKVRRFNIVTFLASLIFLASFGASVGAFAYKKTLEGVVELKGAELATAREELDESLITQYELLDYRLKEAKRVLREQEDLSGLLTFFEGLTLHNIQLDHLTYKRENYTAIIDGLGTSLNSLALQSDILKRQDIVRDLNYSDITLVDEGVEFTMEVRINPLSIKRYNP